MVVPADTIAGATAISGASGATDPFDITTYTVETGEQATLTFDRYLSSTPPSNFSRGIPDHQVLMANSAWVAWTCPADGRYAFSTLGSPTIWDSVLQVYESQADNSPAALEARKLTENDDGIINVAVITHLSYAPFDATAGTVYLIRVCGFAPPVAGGNNTVLSWAPVPVATNDDLATPEDVTGDSGTISDDTTGARELAALEVGWLGPERAVFSRFTPPRGGRYTFMSGAETVTVILEADSDDPRAAQGARWLNPADTLDVLLPAGAAIRIGLANADASPGPVSASWVFDTPTAFATLDVSPDSATTPDVPLVAPPDDYVGDDDSDLVDYPDPDYDAFGRPVNR